MCAMHFSRPSPSSCELQRTAISRPEIISTVGQIELKVEENRESMHRAYAAIATAATDPDAYYLAFAHIHIIRIMLMFYT